MSLDNCSDANLTKEKTEVKFHQSMTSIAVHCIEIQLEYRLKETLDSQVSTERDYALKYGNRQSNFNENRVDEILCVRRLKFTCHYEFDLFFFTFSICLPCL